MSFVLSNEHIKHQLTYEYFANAMDITSFLEDGIVFSDGYNLSNAEWKAQWMKYCNIIMPLSGYDIKISKPYTSEKLKNVTEYEIYRIGKLITGTQTYSEENAYAQAYIQIYRLSTFSRVRESGMKKIEWLINKIEKNPWNFFSNVNSRNYRLKYDLNEILKNKALLREWKLSTIEI